jgi:hypothetical protein
MHEYVVFWCLIGIGFGVARPLRIEYPGAVYHVICHGNNRQAIFRDDQDESDIWKSFPFIARTKASICCVTVYCPTTSICWWRRPKGIFPR